MESKACKSITICGRAAAVVGPGGVVELAGVADGTGGGGVNVADYRVVVDDVHLRGAADVRGPGRATDPVAAVETGGIIRDAVVAETATSWRADGARSRLARQLIHQEHAIIRTDG